MLKPDEQLDYWRGVHGYTYEASETDTRTVKKRCFTCEGRGKTMWGDEDDVDYCMECSGDGYTEHLDAG